ncbi:Uncharacterised protein [Enterobacter hormaechei]|uniref:hypothetical protein n=1 Tax=Enterobacter hormaechei TaxID=158836 RepID=UPI00079CA80B|nr:hypothetical protein [Enterobacter hormaechei]MBY4585243.1 hypothetical protein [Enterobacter hormaechei]SAF21802.1 Uncharacterised protein [Enterobacter hormaechei]
MDIKTTATNEGRIVALQVGFTALVHMLSRDNPKIRDTLINHLEETGMNPVNASSSPAFYELAEMIRDMGHIHE